MDLTFGVVPKKSLLNPRSHFWGFLPEVCSFRAYTVRFVVHYQLIFVCGVGFLPPFTCACTAVPLHLLRRLCFPQGTAFGPVVRVNSLVVSLWAVYLSSICLS